MDSPLVPPDGEAGTSTSTVRPRPGPGMGRIPHQRRRQAPRPAAGGGTQPLNGAAGLVLVAAVGFLIGLAPGPQGFLERVGPLATFCLPLLVGLALWALPQTAPPRPLLALGQTAALLAGGVLLTAAGQAVVGSPDLAHLFSNTTVNASGHLTAYPVTLPLAGLVLVVMLEITLVCRRWPFAGLPPAAGALAALGLSCALGSAGYLLINWDAVPPAARDAIGLRNPAGPIEPLNLLAYGMCVIAWQATIFLLLDGWPLTLARPQAAYLALANTIVLGGAYLTWLALDGWFDRTAPQIMAAAAAAAAAATILGVLFEGWPTRLLPPTPRRAAALALTAACATALGYALWGLGKAAETWTRQPVHLWAAITALTLLSGMSILHARIWRYWPTCAAQRTNPPPAQDPTTTPTHAELP